MKTSWDDIVRFTQKVWTRSNILISLGSGVYCCYGYASLILYYIASLTHNSLAVSDKRDIRSYYSSLDIISWRMSLCLVWVCSEECYKHALEIPQLYMTLYKFHSYLIVSSLVCEEYIVGVNAHRKASLISARTISILIIGAC